MDASHFASMVTNFTSLDEAEAGELSKLTESYPYSQVLHAMKARAAHDRNQPDETRVLHESAVYAADRAILKWVMTTPVRPRTNNQTPEILPTEHKDDTVVTAPADAVPAAPEAKVPEPQPSQVAPTAEIDLSGDALRDDLMSELNRLQKLKHDFEATADAIQHGLPLPVPTAPAAPAKKRKAKAVPDPSTDKLLEEIKTSRKKSHPATPRQKEQNEIIDQFIREQPAMPKPKASQPQQDLAEDSGAFTDNIISETLVDILLKQGKKEKALEVLRKLIWKFPQKKAYFAAQIEKLKS